MEGSVGVVDAAFVVLVAVSEDVGLVVKASVVSEVITVVATGDSDEVGADVVVMGNKVVVVEAVAVVSAVFKVVGTTVEIRSDVTVLTTVVVGT